MSLFNNSGSDSGEHPSVASEIPATQAGVEDVTRVLIADQNSTVRKILRRMLGAMGCETIEAENGEEALELARQRPTPQAIIVSLNLPKVDGYEVCRQLKCEEVFQLTPLIVITENDTADEKQRALDVGADDYLRKPINRVELTFRLRALLRIQKFNQELIGAESVAMALARAVAAKDGYSHCHVERVASQAVALGELIGLDPTEQKVLRYGAILHNVGKISIPDAVLEKTGPLTPREMALFQQHPRVGCDICAPLKPLQSVVPIIRHHKERWDGSGYPDGLRSEEIPLGAQIVGLVDSYTAMTSNRPYRKAAAYDDAIQHLRRQADEGWYNLELVEQFVQCLESQRGNDEAVVATEVEEVV